MKKLTYLVLLALMNPNSTKMKKFLLLTILIVPVFALSQIINIPDDYPTIQEGIDAASYGDTVLVQPGTYIESINYNGKNITLGSLFLTTLDTSYISQTIIDGSQPVDQFTASVVTLSGVDSTSVLSGFTISNGQGTRLSLPWSRDFIGGGILILGSNPSIENVIIQGNSASVGGGIYCGFNSNPALLNVTITENIASGSGGGIYTGDSLSIMNCKILNNSALAGNGGGICSGSGDLSLAGISVIGNTARNGGGVCLYSSKSIFGLINESSIYNNHALIGNDLYSETEVTIIIDTFSVLLPTEYHASPIENFEFKVLNGKLIQESADLYVSPLGENSNSGLSESESLKNIRTAFSKIIADSIESRTIYLADGTYSPSENGDFYPLNIPDYVNLVGESESGTILDGENQSALIRLIENTGTHMTNLTITNGQGGSESTGGSTEPYEWAGGITCHDHSNPVIENITVIVNSSGIYCTSNSHPTLNNISIVENDGRGLYCEWRSNPEVTNTSIAGNASSGIVCDYSNPTLLNLTIKDNLDHGVCFYRSSPVLKNSIITNNSAKNGGGIKLQWGSNPSLENVTISNNSASEYGGGIYCRPGASPELKNVTIKGNSAHSGGGIFCHNSTVIFNSNDRCNIYLNNAVYGNDFFSDTYMDVVVDTFTVLHPSIFHAYPIENFSFDILHGKIEQSNADLFVSPFGDNNNNGLSAIAPLKTIHHAYLKILSDDLNPHTINLMNGIYSPLTNEEFYPRLLQDFISLTGESEDSVVLNAEGLSQVLMFEQSSGANLSDLTITGGIGSGISMVDSNPAIQNVTLKNNTGTKGGGIYSQNSNPELIDVKLTKNSSIESGGGIFFDHSNPIMENVSITENLSDKGGGMYLTESNVVFSSDKRCNIYLNKSRGIGSDIFAFQNNPVHVIVDTFTVFTPTDYYASDIDLFTFDILNSIYGNLINSDLYISVNGDNSNSGTSPDNPLKTINYALSRIYADSLNHHTIHLLPGTYSHSTNGEEFPITMFNYVSLKGSGEAETKLDAESMSGVMRFNCVKNSTLEQLTIQNGYTSDGGGIYCYKSSPILKHLTITGNYANNGGGIYSDQSNPIIENIFVTNNHTTGSGGGIALSESNPLIENTTISGNTAFYGGGISCSDSSPRLTNVYITDNSLSGIYGGNGGGLQCQYSNPVLENVIITGNSSNDRGGGISCDIVCSLLLKNVTVTNNTAIHESGGLNLNTSSSATLFNSIYWNNSPNEICVYGNNNAISEITIFWSNIEGGPDSIVQNQSGNVYWMEGNLDEDPYFTGTGEDPFALSEFSPCIDAGTSDTTGLNLPPYDLIGNERVWDGDGNDTAVIDMGAYEYGSIPVGTQEITIPKKNEQQIVQYPNPFSTSTIIEYELQQPETVQIILFNHLGKQIELIRQNQSAGKQQFVWNAEDLPSGMYFCVLNTNGKKQRLKMIKLR